MSNETSSKSPQCLGCQHETPTAGPRVCPICRHEFGGKAWEGIDVHWRSHHEKTMPYEQFWKTLCPAHRGTRFANADPNYHARMLTSFRRQGFMHHLGVKMIQLEPGHCELELPFRDELSQQHGYFHGGVVASLADVASGYAAYSLTESNASMVTAEFKVNFLAPATGRRLIARGSVVKPGKTLTVCQSEIFCETDGGEKLCAIALATFVALPDKPEKHLPTD